MRQHARARTLQSGSVKSTRFRSGANAVPDVANAVPDVANAVPDVANAVPDVANAVPDVANSAVRPRLLSV